MGPERMGVVAYRITEKLLTYEYIADLIKTAKGGCREILIFRLVSKVAKSDY
jgi:hypothetical protein